MVSTVRLVLADQLTRGLSALCGLDPQTDTVLMVEVRMETDYVRHHPKKIAFLFAAMRHFADSLRMEGISVRYITLDMPDNTHAVTSELDRAVKALRPDRVIMTECGEWRLDQMLRAWASDAASAVEIRADDRFMASKEDFASWAKGRKQLRMEYFYREMRRRYHILIEQDGSPVGGKWNYDSENRKPFTDGGLFQAPPPPRYPPDEITSAVLTLVETTFGHHAGGLYPFAFAVTADQAEAAFERFICQRLALFGDFQDAMVAQQATLFHALIGLYLNAGLLDPLTCCRRAEQAYHDGQAPLNAVEGFIRQILGWREYVRGLYWLKMPHYAQTNFLRAERSLPDFFWTGETKMRCLSVSIRQTLENAYAHHIQRLMVIGNFALLAGLAPKEVCAWYLAVYADAYEWVELPNTHGMALYADGGIVGSKPYAASGKYIDRMSDYCNGCAFSPKKTVEKDACPFNALYWDFLMRNAAVLAGNPRMALIYKSLNRMTADRQAALRARAVALLETLP